jgi:hypothetical protein
LLVPSQLFPFYGVSMSSANDAAMRPLCDRHHVPMAFAAFEENGIEFAGYAYFCWQAGCRRWYEPAVGYFDVVNNHRIPTSAHATCPSHDLPLYERHFDFMVQTVQLRCPHAYCFHNWVRLVPAM